MKYLLKVVIFKIALKSPVSSADPRRKEAGAHEEDFFVVPEYVGP